jgi:hypothetical protein
MLASGLLLVEEWRELVGGGLVPILRTEVRLNYYELEV